MSGLATIRPSGFRNRRVTGVTRSGRHTSHNVTSGQPSGRRTRRSAVAQGYVLNGDVTLATGLGLPGDQLPAQPRCRLNGIRVRLHLSTTPNLFRCHPNLSDEVNRDIVQSEIEGGVFLNDLPPSTVLEIQTRHHCYQLVLLDDNNVLISGHPFYCPEPIRVAIAGSTWGGSMLKRRFVGRGMHLEFRHPEYRTPIVTSPVQEIREAQSEQIRDQCAGVDRG